MLNAKVSGYALNACCGIKTHNLDSIKSKKNAHKIDSIESKRYYKQERKNKIDSIESKIYKKSTNAKLDSINIENIESNNFHYKLLLDSKLLAFENDICGDINDYESLESSLLESKPDIIFHLAAQPLVRESYNNPAYTFNTNALGSLNILDIVRKHHKKGLKNLKAIVMITTDKVYENKEWLWAYRENDGLGGYDTYSASKACAEIIISSMRNSFFNVRDFGVNHNVLIASVRAGNVIGGGDFSKDRLLPDLVRGMFLDSIKQDSIESKTTIIRNPDATRPWQHVLEALRGYLMLGAKLLNKQKDFATCFNIGPNIESNKRVGQVVRDCANVWSNISYKIDSIESKKHEATLLMLDSTKARSMLGYTPIFNYEDSIKNSILWYKSLFEDSKILSKIQIESYMKLILDSNTLRGGGVIDYLIILSLTLSYKLFINFIFYNYQRIDYHVTLAMTALLTLAMTKKIKLQNLDSISLQILQIKS
ncbi:CDP-glucose 4,6-dehydratase [Helicobacter saguini]|uniref:CDP-glucose 4,6-dehydratase n=1 Tax=Helicobacter saguini TaxID=1548018 RepID=A0A6L7DDB6_9HELI|nr:CDP-glucose 4,6-dehydratase [Helicobacter saguini]MWV71260.1 CDP-glucose 4,6-dehydratase [Helicobacter saguini]